MGIISPRDFVDVILVKKYEDGTVSSNGVQTFLFPFPFLKFVLLGFCIIKYLWKSISASKKKDESLNYEIKKSKL